MKGTIADVRCPTCGAPARYDIIAHQYLCGHCGGRVSVSDAIAQKQGFRSAQQEKLRQSAGSRRLMRAECTGCGASIVFEESEAMSVCAFCGRALVRKSYISSPEMPEMVIPFRITGEEARECLSAWCRANAWKPEARHIRRQLDKLMGFYLPYALVRGPVSCRVSRMDAGRIYHCEGYVDPVFVNCSRNLDNLLLDGMEPYELEELEAFDFAYLAGQRVKMPDLDAPALQSRIDDEVSVDYTPTVRKTLETKAVEVQTDSQSALRLPVLLPVYYICSGETMAAVNGQTGKVSVRAEKPSHYCFIPWWFKAILATLLISAGAALSFMAFGMAMQESLFITALLAIVLLIVTLAAYSDTVRQSFRVETRRRVFTSSGGPLRRVDGKLKQDAREIRKEVTPPVFFEKLDGKTQPVQLRFSSPRRTLKTIILALLTLFLPVIIALLLNGFDFARLELGGSAAWFCITVPVVPIYILKFSRIELYERPWIYLLREDGTKKRYRRKPDLRISWETLRSILRAVFVPPVSLAVWFGIISFCVMCYLTAFGFD